MEFKPDLCVSSDPTKLAGDHKTFIAVLCLYMLLFFINLLELFMTKLASQFVEVCIRTVVIPSVLGPVLWSQKR